MDFGNDLRQIKNWETPGYIKIVNPIVIEALPGIDLTRKWKDVLYFPAPLGQAPNLEECDATDPE